MSKGMFNVLVCAVVSSAVLAAQDKKMDSMKMDKMDKMAAEKTYTGCLVKSENGGFSLSSPMAADAMKKPMAKDSMKGMAKDSVGALKDGTLPAGAKFPNGSIVFKEVRTTGGVTMSYAVMYRNAASDLAGEGWLWAEFAPDGRVYTSIRDRGNGCVSCHALERGRQNDLVRTFERQH